MAKGYFDRVTSDGDDILMTPIMNTPRGTEVWTTTTEQNDVNSPFETPWIPPIDLPMSSGIGLRSPCDGILAKRRKQMREMNKKISHDTRLTDTSSMDIRSQRSISDHQSDFISNGTEETFLPVTLRDFSSSSPRSLVGVFSLPLGIGHYELPTNIQNLNPKRDNDRLMLVHSSPIKVPSPVELFFGAEPIGTLQNLDTIFLDMGPESPRNTFRIRNQAMNWHSGRDQRLSLGLSHRFSIPDPSTDQSGNRFSEAEVKEVQTTNEAQDLSTKSLKPSSAQMADFGKPRNPEWASVINHPHFQQNFQSQDLSTAYFTSKGNSTKDSFPENMFTEKGPPINNTSLFQSKLMEKIKQEATNEGKTSSSNKSNKVESQNRKKGKEAKLKKEFCLESTIGNKRQYVCQYCQRSYDWKYNLNRHQKYECGKENAFQCAKCGRKFPHKQNCVYHLKRKHKVIFDTIDRYMIAGLVIFRGASDPTGHEEAVPAINSNVFCNKIPSI